MARRSKMNVVIGASTGGAVSGIKRVTGATTGLFKAVGLLSGVGGAAGIAALGVATIKQSFKFEALKLRLEAVTGSAQKARKIFGDVFGLFRKSPLLLEPLLNARILLEGIGVKGNAALKSVAEAAVAMGKDVVQVAQSVASLETEPLRRLGIEMRRVGEGGTITFRDKMDRQIKLVGKSTEQLRQQLLKVFSIRFGGFLGKAAMSGQGLFSTMVGNLQAAMAQVGDEFAGAVKKGLRKTNVKLNDLITENFFGDLTFQFKDSIVNAFKEAKTAFSKGGIVGLLEFGTGKMKTFFTPIWEDMKDALTHAFDPLVVAFHNFSDTFAAGMLRFRYDFGLIIEKLKMAPKGVAEDEFVAGKMLRGHHERARDAQRLTRLKNAHGKNVSDKLRNMRLTQRGNYRGMSYPIGEDKSFMSSKVVWPTQKPDGTWTKGHSGDLSQFSLGPGKDAGMRRVPLRTKDVGGGMTITESGQTPRARVKNGHLQVMFPEDYTEKQANAFVKAFMTWWNRTAANEAGYATR